MPVEDRQREARLEARIRELEDELYRREGRGGGRRGGRRRSRFGDYEDVRDEAQNFTDRKIDEVSRLLTGAVRAGLEGLRVAAESTSYFVEDSLERSIPDSDEDAIDVAQRLPADVGHGKVRALGRGLDAPSRAIERFSRVYTEEEGGRRRRRRTRTRTRTSASRGGRRVPPGEDYDQWSRHDLYDRAAELGIDDYGQLSRDELIDEIREEQPRYEEWTTAQLYLRAGEVGIAGREDMDRDELIDALRERESRARPARTQIERKGTDERNEYERLTTPELVQRAEDLGIADAASKSRDELIDHLRNYRPELEDMSKEDLLARARELDIPGRSTMNREELIAAIRERESQS
jgi:hypothetical protein